MLKWPTGMNLLNWLNKLGGKRWVTFIIVTGIYIYFENKDQFTWATYVMFCMAWAKLETDRKGGT